MSTVRKYLVIREAMANAVQPTARYHNSNSKCLLILWTDLISLVRQKLKKMSLRRKFNRFVIKQYHIVVVIYKIHILYATILPFFYFGCLWEVEGSNLNYCLSFHSPYFLPFAKSHFLWVFVGILLHYYFTYLKYQFSDQK